MIRIVIESPSREPAGYSTASVRASPARQSTARRFVLIGRRCESLADNLPRILEPDRLRR
jgi:hypothetical protein